MEIPGYVFDSVKNKYFKIEKNHAAPSGSPYSHEAVVASRQQEQIQRTQDAHHQRERSQRIKHDRSIHHPLTSLQHRLGNVGPGSATPYVAEYYGSALKCCRATRHPFRTAIHFDIESSTNSLIMACIDPTGEGPTLIGSTCLMRDETVMRSVRPIVNTPGQVGSIVETKGGLVLWIETSSRPSRIRLKFRVQAQADRNISINVANSTLRPQEQSQIRYTFPDVDSMSLAASPHGDHWLGWTTSKIVVGSGDISGSRFTTIAGSKRPKNDDLLSASFKAEWVLVAGHRSGFVHLTDLREPNPGFRVCRLRHDSPLNGLKCLKNDHHILANGLTSTSLYDLRYLAASAPNRSESCSKPCLTFSVDQRTSDRNGLGMDYYPEMNVIAIASSRGQARHNVTLYSTTSGSAIPSRLGRNSFEGPIACLKFTEPQNQPKGLVMVPDSEKPAVLEWGFY